MSNLINISEFEMRVPGKWVLSGEHAVIRGAKAVTLPHPEFSLHLNYEPREGPYLEVEPGSLKDLVAQLVRRFERLGGKPLSNDLTGFLEIDSNIPIGAGVGSSAAICVAITKWLGALYSLPEGRRQEVATRLEDHFHGKSSGMDVASCLAGEPIEFVRNLGAKELGVRKIPRFSFHDTGLRSITKECVSEVEKMLEENPELGRKIDERMNSASELAIEGLYDFDRGDEHQGVDKVSDAMKKAQSCFLEWNLLPEKIRNAEKKLYDEGALAVKITGAGKGGFLVALWE